MCCTGAVQPRVAAGIERADVGLAQQASLDARNCEIVAGEAVVFARPHMQHPEILRAGLAGHLGAEVDFLRRGIGTQADPPAATCTGL